MGGFLHMSLSKFQEMQVVSVRWSKRNGLLWPDVRDFAVRTNYNYWGSLSQKCNAAGVDSIFYSYLAAIKTRLDPNGRW
jgi:hypothetical protein